MASDQVLLALWYLYVIIIALLAAGLVFVGLPRKAAVKEFPEFLPRALVVVPCRGVDFSLEENLRSLKVQDYPDYDLVAVVDDESDPSVEVLDRLSIEHMISRFECSGCSGKTRAISTALKEKGGYGAYVICDSDILASEDWLRRIVAPLGDSKTGISTTFPYFNPVGGIWSKVKAVWGIVGQGLMEAKLTRFGWGGSLAFREDLLDGDSFLEFSESVSDDSALSSICKRKGLSISYSPKAQPLINSPDDFPTFFEWANRQTALSISATRRVYQYGILIYVSSILVFISAIALSLLSSPLFLLLFVPMAMSEYNNARRSRKMFPSLFLITIALPFLFLINLLIAGRMESIQWRGREYVLQKQEE